MTDWGWATPGNLESLAADAPGSDDPVPVTASATGDRLGAVPEDWWARGMTWALRVQNDGSGWRR